MREHFVIKNIRRSIKEAQSRKGMIVGLPEIRIPASHAEVLLGEIDRLKADLEEAQELVARYDGIKDDLQMDKAELQNQLAEAKTANLAIRSERDQAVAQLHAELAEARAEVKRWYEDAIEVSNRNAIYIQEAKAQARQDAAGEIFKYFDPWFTSGNSIQVERATILTKDYSAIKSKFKL